MQIIKIKDKYYAVNDGKTLSDAEIQKLQSLPEPDIRLALNSTHDGLDFAASRMLQEEIQKPYVPNTQPFKNELSDNTAYKNLVKQREKTEKVTYFFADYTVPDKFIPQKLQQNGLQINSVTEFYQVKYDDKTKKCILTDNNGQEVELNSNRATRSSTGITIYDKAFGFDQASVQIINSVDAHLKNPPAGQTAADAFKALPKKEREVYSTYRYYLEHYLNPNQKFYSLSHEMHHELCAEQIDERRADVASGNLSIEDHFRLIENNEKTAHIAETLEGIRQYYLTKGKLESFPSKCKWLTDDLKKLSPAEIDAKLADMNYIVNGTIENWNKNYADSYRKSNNQFHDQMLKIAWSTPAHKISEDHDEYLRQRSMMFTFAVFNKDTGKKEIKDLSSFIKQDVEITPQLEKDYLNTIRKIVLNRQSKLVAAGLTPDILRQMNEGTLPDNFIVPEPQKLTVTQNTPAVQPVATPPQNVDFKDSYRKFYTVKAKQENSKYVEDTKSPHYEAKLERSNGEELNITATSANSITLGAKDKDKKSKVPDYEDFKDIVKLAKQRNQIISFGDIKTPEYKARLLLACLEGGMPIKNMPNFDELKNIEPETRQRLAAQRIQLLRRTAEEKEKHGEYSNLNNEDKLKRQKIEQARETIRQARKNKNQQPADKYNQAVALIKARQKAMGRK